MNNAGIIDLLPRELRQQWVQDGTYPNQSVYSLFRNHAKAHPSKPAILALDKTVTYGELLDKANRLANSLQKMGIVDGDVVAYQLKNTWRCCAIDLAVAALGAIVAPFPPGRGRLDIELLIKRCSARVVIVEPQQGDLNMGEIIQSLRPKLLSLRSLVMNGHKPEGWLNLDDLFDEKPIENSQLPTVCADWPVRLLVSSGTESEPKLVAYSHNALVGGRGRFLQRIDAKGDTFRGLYLVPMGSSFGSTATFGILSWLGGSIVLLPKFDVSNAIKAIEQLRPSYILGVPTMMQRIAAEPALQHIDKSSLKALISGGSIIDETTIKRCIDKFGCNFINLYGSADGVNCHNLLDESLDAIIKSVGKPNPSICDIRIIDENGIVVPQGSMGEIVARGPLSPMQYVNAPDMDNQYRDMEGWVYTGDLGYIDKEGYLVLSGRKKDVIIRGGANISPTQIENLATAHPNIVSAACVPVPDDDLGHRVCICVTLCDQSKHFSLTELTDFLREQGLEVNKLPEYLQFYKQLPLNPAGKIDKKQLTEKASRLHRKEPLRKAVGDQVCH
ncbi:MAG: class I adenylate-forming enzyme family protein [Arenicella sp.]